MQFIPTEIPDVLLIQPDVMGDKRGYFMELFHAQTFAQAGIHVNFVQDNQSGSHRGTLRGLLRVGNLLDRRHVGSVIVNEGNGRYYEPGPGRSLLLGLEWLP